LGAKQNVLAEDEEKNDGFDGYRSKQRQLFAPFFSRHNFRLRRICVAHAKALDWRKNWEKIRMYFDCYQTENVNWTSM
jgi:hypothetical protein